jgi:hypothetical protein
LCFFAGSPRLFFRLKIQKVQINSATSLKIVNNMVFYCSNNPKKQKNVLLAVYFSLRNPYYLYTEVASEKHALNLEVVVF